MGEKVWAAGPASGDRRPGKLKRQHRSPLFALRGEQERGEECIGLKIGRVPALETSWNRHHNVAALKNKQVRQMFVENSYRH